MGRESGCGHASCLFEWEHMEAAPQVHVHFLTEEEEYELTGFWKVELCCHGCGEAQLVYYQDANRRKHLSIRDAFTLRHAKCEDRGFAGYCIDYRRRVEKLDLRVPRGARIQRARRRVARPARVAAR